MELRVPELGEGIESATVVNVLVKAGDAVEAEQPVVEVETDKANMAIPAAEAGTIDKVLVKVGDKVQIGDPILKMKADGKPAESEPEAESEPKAEGAKSPPPPPPAPARESGPRRAEFAIPDLGEGIESATVVGVLVGPGDAVEDQQSLLEVETDKANLPIPAPGPGKVEEVRVKQGDKVHVGDVVMVLSLSGSAEPAEAEPEPEAKGAEKSPQPAAKEERKAAPARAASGNGLPTPASPSTRRFARELGVDIGQVRGSASGGRVVADDVKEFVRGRMNGQGGGGTGLSLPPLPDFSKYGSVERKPVSKLRETIARNMTTTWHACPMVTQHDLADITDLEAGRRRVSEGIPKGSPKITMTVLAVKAVVAALKSFPQFNASFDMQAGEVILKKYFHVGIAVDTERGLVVPVIRDADRKSLHDIAKEVTGLAGKARDGKLTIDEMRGGSFTITNLGGIGGTAFTPIVNYPEVAILGIARSREEPVYRDGQFVPRLMMPLCLTYDHRIIDGADGARFTSRLRDILSDPIRLLMES